MHPCPPYCLVVGILCFHIGTDYILSMHSSVFRRKHFGTLVPTPLTRDSRWGQDYSSFPCWFPIFIQHLGFNLMPSNIFFLLSLPSRLSLFHLYVVVILALRISSIISLLCWRILTVLRTDFSIRWLFRKRSLNHD